VYGGNSAFSVR